MTKRIIFFILLLSLFSLFHAQFPTPEEFQNSSVFFNFNVTAEEYVRSSNLHHRRHNFPEGDRHHRSPEAEAEHTDASSPPPEKPWWEDQKEGHDEVRKNKLGKKVEHFLKKHRVWVIVALVLLKIALIALMIYCGIKCYHRCQKKKQQRMEIPQTQMSQQELAHQNMPPQQHYYAPGMNMMGGQMPLYYGVPLNPNQPQQPYIPIQQPHPQNFHPMPPPQQGYCIPQQQRYPILNERMNYPPQCAVLGEGNNPQNAGYPRV